MTVLLVLQYDKEIQAPKRKCTAAEGLFIYNHNQKLYEKRSNAHEPT